MIKELQRQLSALRKEDKPQDDKPKKKSPLTKAKAFRAKLAKGVDRLDTTLADLNKNRPDLKDMAVTLGDSLTTLTGYDSELKELIRDAIDDKTRYKPIMKKCNKLLRSVKPTLSAVMVMLRQPKKAGKRTKKKTPADSSEDSGSDE